MAARLQAATGMDWIDAPVSGGPPAAEQGTLWVLDNLARVVLGRAVGECSVGRSSGVQRE